jgi:hypothetical protein
MPEKRSKASNREVFWFVMNRLSFFRSRSFVLNRNGQASEVRFAASGWCGEETAPEHAHFSRLEKAKALFLWMLQTFLIAAWLIRNRRV